MKHHHSETTCPLCGSLRVKFSGEDAEIASMISGLSPRFGRLVAALIEQTGTFVPTEILARRIWADDPHGGPVHTRVVISTLVRQNRDSIPGWRIESKRHSGYRIVREQKI